MVRSSFGIGMKEFKHGFVELGIAFDLWGVAASSEDDHPRVSYPIVSGVSVFDRDDPILFTPYYQHRHRKLVKSVGEDVSSFDPPKVYPVSYDGEEGMFDPRKL